MRIFIILLLLCLVTLIEAAAEYYLEIDLIKKDEIEKLSRLVSIHKLDEAKIYAYANEKELQKLSATGYSYRIIPGPLSGFTTEMATSPERMRDWDFYPTYDVYLDLMYQFAEDYPDICDVFSIGSSLEGRQILVAHIGDDLQSDDDEPEFYYMGQIHGDELVTSIILMHLIDDLLQNYGSDPRIDNIISEIDLYINPLANPDGLYAGGNHTVTDATRGNANGIDLNRNHPDFEDGMHPDGNEYQPETIAQMDFAAQHNFVMAANLHSGAEVVNYPWDTWSTLHADDNWWQMVSRTYADAAQAASPANYLTDFNNGITNGYQWYSISGGHQDYMNWFHHCRNVTLELSSVMAVPANQLRNYYEWNYDSLLLYLEESLYGLKGVVNTGSGNFTPAVITLQQHDHDHSEVLSETGTGLYYRPVYPGTYDLQISAWGFETEVIYNITVPEMDVIEVNASLAPAAICQLDGIITDQSSGLPVFGAWAMLQNTPLDAVMTNGEGFFSLDDIPAGEYEIAVIAAGYLSIIESLELSAGPNTCNFSIIPTDAISFETGELPADYDFSFEGNADWFITDETAANGFYSIRSGDINDNETSALLLNIVLIEPGDISFSRKVSSEYYYDVLRFYIDDVLQNSWSGSLSWESYSYDLTAGTHSFYWEYDKDVSVSNGSDCAWIDDILINGTPEIDVIYGDVDNNGEIGAFDASLVQRFFVEMFPGNAAPLPWQYWRMLRADVDANGYIEAYDASLILQFYVGIIDQFPAAER